MAVSDGGDRVALTNDFGGYSNCIDTEVQLFDVATSKLIYKGVVPIGSIQFTGVGDTLIVSGLFGQVQYEPMVSYENVNERTDIIVVGDKDSISISEMSGAYRVSASRTFLHDTAAICLWPSAERNSSALTRFVGKDFADYRIDGCSVLNIVFDKKFVKGGSIVSLLNKDTIAILSLDRMRYYDRVATFPLWEIAVAISDSGKILVWNYSEVPDGTPGIYRWQIDTLAVKTATPFDKPSACPIDRHFEFQLESHCVTVNDYVFYTEEIGTCSLSIIATSDAFPSIVDSYQIDVRPLVHDESADQYWAIFSSYSNNMSHLSLGGTTIAGASSKASLLIDVQSSRVDVRAVPPGGNVNSVFASDNGIMYVGKLLRVGSTPYYQQSSTTFYELEIIAREGNGEFGPDLNWNLESSESRGTFDDFELSFSPWRSVTGSLLTNYNYQTRSSIEDPISSRVHAIGAGRLLDKSQTTCLDPVYPVCQRNLDYNSRTNTFLSVNEIRNIYGKQAQTTLKRDLDTCVSIERNWDGGQFVADGEFIVTRLGVFSRELVALTMTSVFKDGFTEVGPYANLLTSKGRKLMLWRLPDASLVDSVELHALIKGASCDSTGELTLVQFHNGTIELFRTEELFRALTTVHVANTEHGFNVTRLELPISVSISPQPSIDHCTITCPLLMQGGAEVSVFDYLGNKLASFKPSQQTESFDWDLHANYSQYLGQGNFILVVRSGFLSSSTPLTIIR